MSEYSLHIEYRELATLKPYQRNARTHSKKQIRQIADSITRFGFTNPVLISDDNEIVAGHGRVAAARLLGISKIPTVRLGHLSAEERRAYVIADNKLALNAGWDQEILAIELQGLIDLEFDLTLTASRWLRLTWSSTAPTKLARSPLNRKPRTPSRLFQRRRSVGWETSGSSGVIV
jgi:ParB-like chromosome segregation protein Spo0J